MNDAKPDAKNVNTITSKPFSKMTGREKLKFIGKLVISICSFGFIYPTILND